MKADIIKILNEEKNICSHGADYVINIEDFEIVAERIVKLFAIPVESKSLPTDDEIEKKLKPILKEIYNSGFDDSSIFSSCFNKWVSQITALTYKPTEWISVDIKKPTESDERIIARNNNFIEIVYYSDKDEELIKPNRYDKNDHPVLMMSTITHWMPLPEFKEDGFQEKLKKYLPEINSNEFPDDSDVAL
jgi:hypothetical protein